MSLAPITHDTPVGQLVARNPALARILEHHRIDYCCGGKLPLADACQRRGADLPTVIAALEAADAAPAAADATDWAAAPLSDLIHNIVSTHHSYLAQELPRLSYLTQKVAHAHGAGHPEVLELARVFEAFRAELEHHAMKEERILFPWIRHMEHGVAPDQFPATGVEHPIRCMEEEHDNAGNALETFRRLTGDFQTPEGACNSWRVLYASLEALEADMHIHVHKENNILFPRALALEESLTAAR
ncbi:MAG: iron-sulfur cluster repair di-iron protein [Candidatus Sumerlaeia bacterium]|nr:iron-sulfur cluster repair di-iron protein [Candidatus Sumerlaeia bacterium]